MRAIIVHLNLTQNVGVNYANNNKINRFVADRRITK